MGIVLSQEFPPAPHSLLLERLGHRPLHLVHSVVVEVAVGQDFLFAPDTPLMLHPGQRSQQLLHLHLANHLCSLVHCPHMIYHFLCSPTGHGGQ